MYEQILAPVIGSNEPVTLLIVEPFDCTGTHCLCLLNSLNQLCETLTGYLTIADGDGQVEHAIILFILQGGEAGIQQENPLRTRDFG
jgi:hypothetical protein